MKFPITSKFNAAESFRESKHTGIDLAMEKGTEIYSINDGVVSKTVDYGAENIGKGVFVEWEDGQTAIYGHLDKILVKEGDIVEAGNLIGLSGNTGNTVGINGGFHLHFGLKDTTGQFINPEPYNDLLQNMSQLNETVNDFTRLDPSTMLESALQGLWELKINLISLLLDVHTTLLTLYTTFL